MTAAAQFGRFTVRDATLWDAPDLLALFGDPETVKYMGVPQLHSVADARSLIERYQTSPTRWLTVREGPKFLGIVGLEIRGHQAMMALASNGVRQGFGREFSVPFVQWVFTHPSIWRMSAICHVDNRMARRVLERMGAAFEGRLRRFEFFPNLSTEPQDVYMYSIARG